MDQIQGKQHKNAQLQLLPENLLVGSYRGYGLFFRRSGKVQKSFTIDFSGVRDGDSVMLSELITLSDGKSTERRYQIRKEIDGRYSLEGDDVVGKASITLRDNALLWSYRLGIMTKFGRAVLSFEDWMYHLPDGVIITRAHARKWGVRIGEIYMCFIPEQNGESA